MWDMDSPGGTGGGGGEGGRSDKRETSHSHISLIYSSSFFFYILEGHEHLFPAGLERDL